MSLEKFDDLWLRIIALLDHGLEEGLKLMDGNTLWKWLEMCLENPDLWFRSDVEMQLGGGTQKDAGVKNVKESTRLFQDWRLKNTIFEELQETADTSSKKDGSSSGTSCTSGTTATTCFSQTHTTAQVCLRKQLGNIGRAVEGFDRDAKQIMKELDNLNDECCQLAATFKERRDAPIRRLRKEALKKEEEVKKKEDETTKFLSEQMTSVGSRVLRSTPWMFTPAAFLKVGMELTDMYRESTEATSKEAELSGLKREHDGVKEDIEAVQKLAEEVYSQSTELGSYLKRYQAWFEFVVDDSYDFVRTWRMFRSSLGKLVQLGDELDEAKEEAIAKASFRRATAWCRGMKFNERTLAAAGLEYDEEGEFIERRQSPEQVDNLEESVEEVVSEGDDSEDVIRGPTAEQKLLYDTVRQNVHELANSAALFVETGSNFYINRARFERMG